MSIGNDELRMIREAREIIDTVCDDIGAEQSEARHDLCDAIDSPDDAIDKLLEGGAEK